MAYMMAPLERHFDDGFGAVADAFKRAAEVLGKANGDNPLFWCHLPEIYLLRHAVELYLKSGIIIIHRRLKLPYGSESHSSPKPMLLTNGEWKPLFRTHDLKELYAYWKLLITEHKDALTNISKNKPAISVPSELDSAIELLNAVDPSSDYFRYPVTKARDNDKEKSSFKEVPAEKLWEIPVDRPEEKVRALVVENEKGEFVRAFKLDTTTNKEVSEAAWRTTMTLSGFHAMMRFEFTDGW